MNNLDAVYNFIQDVSTEPLDTEPLNAELTRHVKRCLADTLAVMAGGKHSELSRIVRELVTEEFADGPYRMLFDEAASSAMGAALYAAASIDSLDAHDGHVLVKGHVGVTVVPGVIILLQEKLATGQAVSGIELLKALYIAYEVSTRAGIALHASACDYHTSGAWNAFGVIAADTFLNKQSKDYLRHALGIAEFYGPRSQMMRIIDYPTMLKDGSAAGAMVAFKAIKLARKDFSGAPAISLESKDLSHLWNDFGRVHRISEQYFKAYPVCRWAQPAVEASLSLKQEHSIAINDIASVEIHSFHQSVRLAAFEPKTSEEAQYSTPFPVAVALMTGTISPEAVYLQGDLQQIQALSNKIKLIEVEEYNKKFPAERWAHAVIHLKNGTVLTSQPHEARGDAHSPLSDDELKDKFLEYMAMSLEGARAQQLHQLIWSLETQEDLKQFMTLI